VCVCVSHTAYVGSDTELIDESYSLYGVKLPTAGRSVVTPQPRSQFPAPAVVPYDATRYAHPPASTNTMVYWELKVMCKLPVNVCVRVIGWVTETVVLCEDITACSADSPTAVTDLSVNLFDFWLSYFQNL